MAVMVYDKCCGCIELKSGCFIIGYLNLVGCIILTIITIMGLIGGAMVTSMAEEKDIDTRDTGIAITILLAITLVFLLISLAFSIVLLVGLHKDKPGHLKAYLIYSSIFIVISIIQFIASLVTASVNAASVVQSLATILLGIYFLLIIRSMYYHMKEPSRGPAIYSAA